MQMKRLKHFFGPLVKKICSLAGSIDNFSIVGARGSSLSRDPELYRDLELYIEVSRKNPYKINFRPFRKGEARWKPGSFPSKEKRLLMNRIEKELLGAVRNFKEKNGNFIEIYEASAGGVDKKVRIKGCFGIRHISRWWEIKKEMIDCESMNVIQSIFKPLHEEVSKCAGVIPGVVWLWHRNCGSSLTFSRNDFIGISFIRSFGEKIIWQIQNMPHSKENKNMIIALDEQIREYVKTFKMKYENVFKIEDIDLDVADDSFWVSGTFIFETNL